MARGTLEDYFVDTLSLKVPNALAQLQRESRGVLMLLNYLVNESVSCLSQVDFFLVGNGPNRQVSHHHIAEALIHEDDLLLVVCFIL